VIAKITGIIDNALFILTALFKKQFEISNLKFEIGG
jgi:hypothetical protein